MSAAKMLSLVFAFVVFLNMQSTILAQNSPQDYLDAHNAARSAVGVADINWNDTLQAYAQDYADQRQGDCSLTHSQGPYGENIAKSSGTDFSGTDAVNMWVDEQQYYDYNSNTCSAGEYKCLHYTQVVWRDTTQLGCARVVCDGNIGVFVICSYYPPGNYAGQWPY